jgi:hypothetical protein
MDDLWRALKPSDWQTAQAVSGRIATEADVKNGCAVFYIPSGSVPHRIALPACAIHHDVVTGRAEAVVVIQAEAGDGQIIVGVRPLEGGNMICTLPELEFVAPSDPRFAGT